jgi:hypothetical protein
VRRARGARGVRPAWSRGGVGAETGAREYASMRVRESKTSEKRESSKTTSYTLHTTCFVLPASHGNGIRILHVLSRLRSAWMTMAFFTYV